MRDEKLDEFFTRYSPYCYWGSIVSYEHTHI